MADCVGNDWEGFMLDIKKTCSSTNVHEVDFEIVYQKLLQTFERKSSLFWHIKYFEQYMMEEINPKGLRVQVFPNMWAIDQDFKARWEHNLLCCSKKMMELMVEYYMQELKLVDCKIKRIYDENADLLNKPEFETYDTRLKEHIQGFTRDLLVKKEEKMSQDKYAFNWPTMNGQLTDIETVARMRVEKVLIIRKEMTILIPPLIPTLHRVPNREKEDNREDVIRENDHSKVVGTRLAHKTKNG